MESIAAPGAVLYRSWPDAHRIHPWVMPCDEEPLSVNEDEGQESLPVIGIDVYVETIARKEWVQSMFDTSESNIYNPVIEWDIAMHIGHKRTGSRTD